ncbi:MAG: GAF domain-containing sensor histidine kinase [Cyanobacteria bacterium P01_D01_bin.36]
MDKKDMQDGLDMQQQPQSSDLSGTESAVQLAAKPTGHSLRVSHAALEYLTALSFRQRDLEHYLYDIACGVSNLMGVDWSVVTLNMGQTSMGQTSKVLASNLDIGDALNQPYPLHGQLSQTVVEAGVSLTVTDSDLETQYGCAPEGYRSYLGVPLRSPTGNILGTVCCFHSTPRSFSSEEVQCAELFAERATTAIDNYQLYQKQLKFNETLEAEVVKRTAQLQAAQAQLIEKERLAAIGEFTAMIVHELRNPLTTIGMGLTALQSSDLSERDRRRLSLAAEEEQRLKKLLNEILQYAKPQLLETTVIDLKGLVQEVVSTLSAQPALCDRQLAVEHIPTSLEVRGDRDKLKQVFINLVSNACEAVKTGDIVSVKLSQPSPHICIEIHNGGDPIPAEVLPRLTQPFFSTKSSGNGLGLAIVKRIVEVHQGTLSFASSLEAGTTATVKLPGA